MCSQIGLLSVLLASGVAAAQTPGATAPIHHSNGVVEMSAKPILAHEPRPQSETREVYSPWAGLVEITIRNISKGVIRLAEIAPLSEVQVEVLESAGQPVDLTEAGKHAANSSGRFPGAISVSVLDLVPLEETTLRLDLAKRFEIKPGQAYKVTIRRSRGLPKTDEDGKPLKNVEVSCSFDVPDNGILR